MSVPLVKLNNDKEIPAIGLGEPERASLRTRKGYGNEKDVGDGIRASGIPRSEIFVSLHKNLPCETILCYSSSLQITSKLWGTWHSRVEECLDQTLTNLGTDYLDLYLVHWPVPLNPSGNHPVFPTLPDGVRDVDRSWKLSDTWKQMEALVEKGKVKSIGVSNFSQTKLEEILPTAKIIPVVNQLELHVYNPQHKLTEYLKSKKIIPQAYSPLGSTNSPLLTDETVLKIAQKHSVNATDVLISYLVAKGFVVLPKSVTPSRIASNLTGSVTALAKLDAGDITELDGLAAAGKQKRFIMPPWPVDLGFDNWPPFKKQ
ncbi:hypothetical protein H0H87_006387 [Tephrocybe sp. NHM501043]|nr:hypothetical protein H0H87_006387 [Tephrocybe sp. NHM501043]